MCGVFTLVGIAQENRAQEECDSEEHHEVLAHLNVAMLYLDILRRIITKIAHLINGIFRSRVFARKPSLKNEMSVRKLDQLTHLRVSIRMLHRTLQLSPP